MTGRPPRPVFERLADEIDINHETGCWEYRRNSAPSRGDGYRQISIGSFGGKAVVKYAHRVAYELLVEEVPADLQIDHLCRVRYCVNPDHLEPVAPRENIVRSKSLIVECPQGHPYDDENTGLHKGRRYCIECNRTRARERYRAKNPPRPKPTHCPQGHEFTPENTRIRPGRGRECRACNRERSAEWRRRRSAPKESA